MGPPTENYSPGVPTSVIARSKGADRMLRAAISLLAAIMLIATCHAVELQESVSVSAMHVTLIPGSSRVLVQEARQIDYAASEQSVAFAYGQARIAVDSVRISPPNGVTVEATHRPAGRDDCVIWDLAGRPVSPSPTRISYELEGLDWKLLYRLDFNPASTTGHSGTATVSAAIEVCNQSGLDLRATSLSLALNGAPDEGCSLRVAGGLRDLPTGWTKQWPVVTTDGASSIATDLAAHVQRADAFGLEGLSLGVGAGRVLPGEPGRAGAALLQHPVGAVDVGVADERPDRLRVGAAGFGEVAVRRPLAGFEVFDGGAERFGVVALLAQAAARVVGG